MAARAIWKGVLKLEDLVCPVALYTAASTAERITFHILNRKTGHRVHRIFVDSETGKPVEAKDQIKGYETGRGDYITFEPEEIAKAMPESDKALSIQAFVPCDQVDDIYFDRPYYLTPSAAGDAATLDLLREGMRREKVAAVARAVLFRRVRSLLIRAQSEGLIATTLNFDYEVRSAEEAFWDLPAPDVDSEMVELALHIIKSKSETFDPKKFDDRYEAAVRDLIAAKMEGRKIMPLKLPPPTKASDLLQALRQSASGDRQSPRRSREKAHSKAHAKRRKAA
jgi:DNA end-binding protein Ku